MSASLPHYTNTDSTGSSKVLGASLHRSRVGNLLLPSKQTVSLNSQLSHGITIFPANGTPAWGGYFCVDLKSPNLLIHGLTIEWNLGAVVGSSIVGYFNPSFWFFSRIEIVQGGNVISTVTNNQTHLLNQLLFFDEDRAPVNAAAGAYNSTTLRSTMSSTSTPNTFYTNLKTYFDEIGGVPLYNDSQAIQLRFYMANLADVYKVTSGTLTSVAINSVNVIAKTTKLDNVTARNQLALMSQQPFHNIFHDQIAYQYQIPSGVTTHTAVLSGITGKIAALYITVRANLVTDQSWVYNLVTGGFSIADNTGTNICGGTTIKAALAHNLINKDNCKSSYSNETSFGITNNSANFLSHSFSADIISALSDGKCLNSRIFTGAETLTLNWTSATGSALQVDIMACQESILEMGATYVKKLAL